MAPICSVLVVRYYFGLPFFAWTFLPPVNDFGALYKNGWFLLVELYREREKRGRFLSFSGLDICRAAAP